ncbi:hypothetical protein EJ06DRAFT_513402 [Trichodelitschia bisporula]|uniref:Seipin n=1 Tax=Trichodelitschia bisporula TaxID=703511 RepID=A0A6G1HRA0_9PEZI|nr:hypothetical protein EJ06DRAFT_513402 [Trichodelitschia bisporula]
MSDISDDETEVGVLIAAKDALLRPLHYATTKSAQRTYIGAFLLSLASLFLLGVAVSAYLFFYYSFIPIRGFSRPVYLQFAPNCNPNASATLPQELVSGQPYDIAVVLDMPQTRLNKAAGNFMIDLQLFGPSKVEWDAASGALLAKSRRPATMTYHSTAMEYVYKATALPWYLMGWRHEAESLHVDMMDSVEFSKGWKNLPAFARLELQSETRLQIYRAEVIFKARFGGLRYVMYNYQLTSFVVLTGLFWSVEMTFFGLVYLLFNTVFQAPHNKPVKPDTADVKREPAEGGRSDTSATPLIFPTLSHQAPLRYKSPEIKNEELEDINTPPDIPFTLEADDEDESADFVLEQSRQLSRGFSDSGLGTSLESSSGGPESVRKRSSRSSG